MGNQVDQLDLYQDSGLTRVRKFSDVAIKYYLAPASLARTRAFGTTGQVLTYGMGASSLVRSRVAAGGRVVWASHIYSPTGASTGLSVSDATDPSQLSFDIDIAGNITIPGNLAVSAASTIATGALTFGSGGRLDAGDFGELTKITAAPSSRIQVRKARADSVSTLVAQSWNTPPVAGNILFMHVYTLAGTNFDTPSGWTILMNPVFPGGCTVVFTKVAAGADAAPTFVCTTTTSISIITTEYNGTTVTNDRLHSLTQETPVTSFDYTNPLKTTASPELWLVMVGTRAGGALSSPIGGFSIVDQLLGPGNDSMVLLEQFFTGLGKPNWGVTFALSSAYSSTMSAQFNAASTAVAPPASGKIRYYAKQSGAASGLAYKDDAGVEHDMSLVGAPGGASWARSMMMMGA